MQWSDTILYLMALFKFHLNGKRKYKMVENKSERANPRRVIIMLGGVGGLRNKPQ